MYFMRFPVELRAQIIEHYLVDEAEFNMAGKAIHHDRFGKQCCVWDWPNELVICDKEEEDDLPHTMFPKWLPNLALTSHQMRGEVAVHMLKTTTQVVLKYDQDLPVKIAPWFAEFLATFPGATGTEGINAVKDVNFPHIHWYDYAGSVSSDDTNPEVDLMLKLPKLQRVGFTFHASRIHDIDEDGLVTAVPMSLKAFLNKFKLQPMLGCKSLEHVYIGGIRWRHVEEGDQLQTLREFGQWLRESFKEQGQKVSVHLHPRTGVFCGWGEGEPL